MELQSDDDDLKPRRASGHFLARRMERRERAGAIPLRDGSNARRVLAARSYRGRRDPSCARNRPRSDGECEGSPRFRRDFGDEGELSVHGARVRAGERARRGGQDEVRGGGELGRVVASACDERGAGNVRGEEEGLGEVPGIARRGAESRERDRGVHICAYKWVYWEQ